MKKSPTQFHCPLPTKEETPNETIVRMLNGYGNLVNPAAVLAALNKTSSK
jgi:hypothetical protein